MSAQQPSAEHHAVPPPPATRRRAGADSPGWLPAILIVVIMLFMLLFPAVLSAFFPERAEGTIGFYERVQLSPATETSDAGIPTTAGFIAPEGWIWPDEADHTRFEEADGAARISSELLVGVDDATSALRGVTPTGAAVIPPHALTTDSGLDVLFVDYDLQAGDRVTRDIVVCATTGSACVHFTAEFTDNSPSVQRDVDRTIEQLVDSVEVF